MGDRSSSSQNLKSNGNWGVRAGHVSEDEGGKKRGGRGGTQKFTLEQRGGGGGVEETYFGGDLEGGIKKK